MSKTFKQTSLFYIPAILSLALLVIGSGSYYLVYSYLPAKEEREASAKKLLPLKNVLLDRVMIVGAKTLLILTCVDDKPDLCKAGDIGQWKLKAPMEAKGDSSAISQTLESIRDIAPEETIDLTEDESKQAAQEYGFYTNPRKLVIETLDKKTFTLFFGDNHPFNPQTYVVVASGTTLEEAFKAKKLYLVSSRELDVFEKKPVYFRDKRISLSVANDISELSINNPSAKNSPSEFKLKKEGASWVTTQQPSSDKIDSKEVMSWLSKLTGLEAQDIAFEDQATKPAKTFLNGTTLKLKTTLLTQSQMTETMEFRARKDGKTIYVLTSRLLPVFEIQPNDLTLVAKTLSDFKQKPSATEQEKASINPNGSVKQDK